MTPISITIIIITSSVIVRLLLLNGIIADMMNSINKGVQIITSYMTTGFNKILYNPLCENKNMKCGGGVLFWGGTLLFWCILAFMSGSKALYGYLVFIFIIYITTKLLSRDIINKDSIGTKIGLFILIVGDILLSLYFGAN
tara:strand:- start:83 stop:505 length:423 start_codon:yes stop_codon:yes gene_type:complete